MFQEEGVHPERFSEDSIQGLMSTSEAALMGLYASEGNRNGNSTPVGSSTPFIRTLAKGMMEDTVPSLAATGFTAHETLDKPGQAQEEP